MIKLPVVFQSSESLLCISQSPLSLTGRETIWCKLESSYFFFIPLSTEPLFYRTGQWHYLSIRIQYGFYINSWLKLKLSISSWRDCYFRQLGKKSDTRKNHTPESLDDQRLMPCRNFSDEFTANNRGKNCCRCGKNITVMLTFCSASTKKVLQDASMQVVAY